MIGYLKGEVKSISADSFIILSGGVGYVVLAPSQLTSTQKVGDETEVYVYTHVREDQLSLFGFSLQEELNFFKMLLSVSGIGPKVALAIISSAPVEKIKSSISIGDPSMLSAVSGVGKKTAEKAVIELRGKLGLISSGEVFDNDGANEVIEALLGLGFQKNEIIEGLKRIPSEISNNDEKIKWLVKNLGRKQ